MQLLLLSNDVLLASQDGCEHDSVSNCEAVIPPQPTRPVYRRTLGLTQISDRSDQIPMDRSYHIRSLWADQIRPDHHGRALDHADDTTPTRHRELQSDHTDHECISPERY